MDVIRNRLELLQANARTDDVLSTSSEKARRNARDYNKSCLDQWNAQPIAAKCAVRDLFGPAPIEDMQHDRLDVIVQAIEAARAYPEGVPGPRGKYGMCPFDREPEQRLWLDTFDITSAAMVEVTSRVIELMS